MKINLFFVKPLEKAFCLFRQKALNKASREQGLEPLKGKLKKLVPDIQEQYTMFKVDSDYLKTKVRNLHAFQMSLVNAVIKNFEEITFVDIGDSAGTHLQYIKGLYHNSRKIRCLSVNIDEKAVERIKNKNLEAVNARAEDLDKYNIQPDVFLCFEVLEHLMDPVPFLHALSVKTNASFLIATVPYLRKSRVGLHHIRQNRCEKVSAENTHFFEFNPEDWKLLMRQAGWDVVKEKVYFQYPRRHLLRLMGSLWRRFDFEGFYGVILKRSHNWSSYYQNW